MQLFHSINFKDRFSKVHLTGFKFNVILALGLIIVSIPGILLSKYSIFSFDEPYMILSAYDWRNSIYSPLAAWLGNIYGTIAGWEWIKFRYLPIVLNICGIYIGTYYALRRYRHWSVVIVGIFCCFLCTLNKGWFNIYGWDIWTMLFLTIEVVLLLKYQLYPSLNLISIIGLLAGIIVCVRIPNICIIPFVILILIVLYSNDRRTIHLKSILCFTILSLLSISLILICFYGSLADYLLLFPSNKITDHSTSRIFTSLLVGFGKVSCFVVIFWFFYILVKKISILNIWVKFFGFLLISCCLFYIINILVPDLYFNVCRFIVSITTLGILSIILCHYKNKNGKTKIIAAIILWGLSLVSTIGTNMGYSKILTWTVLPIIVALLGPCFDKPKKIFASLFGIVLAAYSIYAIPRTPWYDDGFSNNAYKFQEGVLKGMKTDKPHGEFIQNVIDTIEPFKLKGYKILPIQNEGRFFWEYMFFYRNPYQRHIFSNEKMLEDPVFAKQIVEEAKGSEDRILVLYFGKYDKTIVECALEKEMYKVIDTPWYRGYIISQPY